MVFLFILDVITSATLHIVANCGYWVACKTSNGAYYLYNKIRIKHPEPSTAITNTVSEIVSPIVAVTINSQDTEYVVITREEYNKLKN